LRILSVTPYYDPEGGGLERYAHAILSRLAQRGHDIRVLTFTQNGGAGTRNQGGVDVRRQRARLRLGNSPIGLRFGAEVSRSIRDLRPDVVVAHTPVPFPAEIAYLAARRHGIPFVATYHAGRLRGSSHALDGLAALDRVTLERRMLAGSARLVAVSPFVRDHALQRHRSRVAVVPPGVDGALFAPGAPPHGPNILFVGPLDSRYQWKGVDVLWDAFYQVRSRLPDATLTLVGNGDRFQEFRGKALLWGAASRVRGRVTDKELAMEYRSASVVALPSTSDAESFGMVLAEANACGRPVVASRIGGIPDFVRDGENGLLACPGDARDLADKLMLVLGNPGFAAAMGRRGRERILREHDWDRLAIVTEGVLEEAARTRHDAVAAA
jgi:glycosyltransferase involved in cell wall biosynthesis